MASARAKPLAALQSVCLPARLGAVAVGASLFLATTAHLVTADARAGKAAGGGAAVGVPFGASKLPISLYGKPFTETKLDVSPESILSDLAEARAGRMHVFIILVGPQHHYQNADGTFNLDKWKARVDRFRGIDVSGFVGDGTILGHQLISEAKARNQFGGTVIPNQVLDEMAQHSKTLWPTMPTMLRTDPSDLEKHAANHATPRPGWKWTYLDAASARYLARKGHVAQFAADEQASADRQKLALVVGLNVLMGGNGSSGISGVAKNKWAMSAEELRQYGSTMLTQTKACAFEMWRYETPGSEFKEFGYFRRPEISAAMLELAALAAKNPARPCIGGQQP